MNATNAGTSQYHAAIFSKWRWFIYLFLNIQKPLMYAIFKCLFCFLRLHDKWLANNHGDRIVMNEPCIRWIYFVDAKNADRHHRTPCFLCDSGESSIKIMDSTIRISVSFRKNYNIPIMLFE